MNPELKLYELCKAFRDGKQVGIVPYETIMAILETGKYIDYEPTGVVLTYTGEVISIEEAVILDNGEIASRYDEKVAQEVDDKRWYYADDTDYCVYYGHYHGRYGSLNS